MNLPDAQRKKMCTGALRQNILFLFSLTIGSRQFASTKLEITEMICIHNRPQSSNSVYMHYHRLLPLGAAEIGVPKYQMDVLETRTSS